MKRAREIGADDSESVNKKVRQQALRVGSAAEAKSMPKYWVFTMTVVNMLQARTHTFIGDLDNGCLLHVLKHLTPLPDLFSIAATCKVCSRPCLHTHSTL